MRTAIVQRRTVQIYSKPGCALCDAARAAVARMRKRIPFEIEDVDIRSAPALWELYRYVVPVVAVDGEEVFRTTVDEPALEARLRGAGTGVAR